MRIILIIIIFIHGLIHLFGFIDAFEISEFIALSQPISKIAGLFCLLTFLLFATTLILILRRSGHWWIFGLIAVFVSQIFIFSHWPDAKFGSIANAIILLAIAVAYADYNFKNIIKKERAALFHNSQIKHQHNIDRDDFSTLPAVVQKWLSGIGVIGKPHISNVYLTQELLLKLKPEQTDWNKGIAEQYFTIQPPGFNWSIKTELNPILGVVGRDKFENGHGEMIIKLLSLIPIADVGNNPKTDQATLQRFLAEMVWFPSACLSPYIQWESLDGCSVRATMKYNGTKGSGIFYFDENGQFEKFIAKRYKDIDDSEPTEWIVSAINNEERNGIIIPVECELSWKLNNINWTWLKLIIRDIEYDIEKMPLEKKAL